LQLSISLMLHVMDLKLLLLGIALCCLQLLTQLRGDCAQFLVSFSHCCCQLVFILLLQDLQLFT